MISVKADLEKSTPRASGRRLNGAILHKLGAAILSGEYAPGDTLSGEIAFSEQLNVSRGAYREAVRMLVAKGLVESRPKTGTRVLAREHWALLDPDVLVWAFSGEPDVGFVKSLFELRTFIEPGAAGLAAERRTRSELKAIKDSLTAMRRKTLSTEEGRAADRDFHRAILKASHNDALITLSHSIGAAVNLTTQFKQRHRDLPRNAIPDHTRVYDAIAAQDAAAASEAMRLLVQLALDDTDLAMAK